MMNSAPILEWRVPDLQWDLEEMEVELGARIRHRLAQSEYRAVQRLACELRDGRLVLRGPIPSYLQVQVAELVQQALRESTRERGRARLVEVAG